VPNGRSAAHVHVFVADVDRPELADEDRHHLERVLRIRPGEEVTVSDGLGAWRHCHYDGSGALTPAGDVSHRPAPTPAVTVAFALAKGERPDWVVQKLTEAGVDRIVPFVAGRTVVRWDGEKVGRQMNRLRAIARAAAMQSRRAWLPVVDNLSSFEVAATSLGPHAALAHPGGHPPSLDRPAVLIGPEGGWNEQELACGLPLVGFGPTILRAETAALAAGLLLCALREQIVQSAASP
jgi:16S rRNA (uracil1498-N3)-methyltransferase